MSDTPTEKFLEALYQATGQQPQQSGNGQMACCPAHEDKTPSLSIGTGDDGRVLLKCFAGCSVDSVCHAVGMTVLDLMPRGDSLPKPQGKKAKNQQSRIVATYDYRDEQAQLLYQVCRMDPKSFRQRKPKPGGGWDWSVKGVRQVPYRLPELLKDSSKVVLVVEGEKDADRLSKLGFLATCNSGGAEKWKPEFAEHFRGRNVVILPDNDEPGLRHADDVAGSLTGQAAAIKVVMLPGLPAKGDVSDWLDAGGTAEQLTDIIKATPTWKSARWRDLEPLEIPLPDFPVDALPEPLGRWVREESHATQTPADLAGLLSLAVCSAAIAKRVEVQARPGWLEPVNLFVAILQEPGTRKSAVFAAAVKPLKEIEAERIQAARPDIAILQSQRRQKESQLKKLEKEAATDARAAHEAGALAAELATTPEPVLPRLILDDATSEKLGMMLADHAGKIASLSPEGGSVRPDGRVVFQIGDSSIRCVSDGA